MTSTSGLINDFVKALGQQLYYFGCDVVYPKGNLLIEFGFQRHESIGKGSNFCYRMKFEEDIVELHQLCVGRYSKTNNSFLFTRQHRRCWIYDSESPPVPGFYDKEKIKTDSKEELLSACRTFSELLTEYENWILKNTPIPYREHCYSSYKKIPKSKSWLSPSIAIEWLKEFHSSPKSLKRSREWM